MAVYVDAAIHRWRGRNWCHLFSSDIAELHAFAARIGMRRGWFQEPPAASWPHYDVPETRRVAALAAGALEADRLTSVTVASEAMLAWCLEHRPDMVPAAAARRDKWVSRRSGAPPPR